MSTKDTAKCSARAYDSSGGGRFYPCSRKGTIEENGKLWCKQHAPSTKRARDEATFARYNAEFSARVEAVDAPRRKIERLEAINRDLLAALKGIKERAGQRYSASATGLHATGENLDAIEAEAEAAIGKAEHPITS